MDIEKYKKLKIKITQLSFEKGYKYIDKILYGFSYLGHFAGISFAYFYIAFLLSNATDNFYGKSYIVALISIVFLVSFEFLKRFLFYKFSFLINSNKKYTSEKLWLGALSLIIVVSSFSLTLSGARNFSDKSEKEVAKSEISTKLITDSLDLVYANKISKIEKDKEFYFKMISQGTRNFALRTQYNKMIDSLNKDIKLVEFEKNNKIKESSELENKKLSLNKSKVGSNVTAFIIISTFIELIILIGVWFDTYYDYKSYKEFDDKINTDQSLNKYMLYDKFLNILYNTGKINKGEQFYSFNKFKDLLEIKGIITTDKSIKDFFTLLRHLNIYRLSGNQKIIEKNIEETKELLNDYFNSYE